GRVPVSAGPEAARDASLSDVDLADLPHGTAGAHACHREYVTRADQVGIGDPRQVAVLVPCAGGAEHPTARHIARTQVGARHAVTPMSSPGSVACAGCTRPRRGRRGTGSETTDAATVVGWAGSTAAGAGTPNCSGTRSAAMGSASTGVCSGSGPSATTRDASACVEVSTDSGARATRTTPTIVRSSGPTS